MYDVYAILWGLLMFWLVHAWYGFCHRVVDFVYGHDYVSMTGRWHLIDESMRYCRHTLWISSA